MFHVVSERRRKIRHEVQSHMQKAFVRQATPAHIFPVLAYDKKGERQAWMNLFLAGNFQFPPKPEKGDVPVKLDPSQLPINPMVIALEPQISIEAFNRLSISEYGSCLNVAFADRLGEIEGAYQKEAEKKRGLLSKMLRLQERMDRLGDHYRRAIETLISGEMANKDYLINAFRELYGDSPIVATSGQKQPSDLR
jgi:hypothetical protein